MVVLKSYVPHEPITLDEPKRVALCREEILGQLKNTPMQASLDVLAGIHGLCYARVNEEDMLLDYGIRRSAFLNQQDQTAVLMWMVVAITLSGVLLAGVQLVAGYRLAYAGKAPFDQSGKIDVESKKVSVSSSVAGVLILAVSLLFFSVFAHEIYVVKEVNPPPGVNSVAGTPNLSTGWERPPQRLSQNPVLPGQSPSGLPITIIGAGIGPTPAKPTLTQSPLK